MESIQALLKDAGINMDLPAQDEEEEDIDEDQMDPEQKYQLWMDNRVYMYDHLIVHKLSQPSLSIQWLPGQIEGVHPTNFANRLVLGTFNEAEGATNSLKLYSVDLPKLKPFIDLAGKLPNFDANSTGAKRCSIKLLKEFSHEGEVNKVQYMPQDPNIIATKTNDGNVNIYSVDKENNSGPVSKLKGVNSEGFPLVWNPLVSGQVAASGVNGNIGLWDLQKEIPTVVSAFQSAVNDLKIHYKRPGIFGAALENKHFSL